MARLGRAFPARRQQQILRTPPLPTISFDAAGSANSAATASLTWSHTVGSGPNRILIVGVGLINALGQRVTGITYGSQSLIEIGTVNNGTAARSELWYLVAPTSGTATITVTLSAAAAVAGGSTSWTGADQQADPFSGYTTGSGTGTSIATDMPSFSDYLVIDNVAAATTGSTVGSGQLQRYSDGIATITAEGSSEPGQTTTTMSWTSGISAAWAQVTVSLAPYVASLSDTPTDSDAGAGTDAVSLIAISSADTGSGSDAVSTIGLAPATDTGNGADAGSAIAPTATETGSGSEGVASVALSTVETGGGSEGTPAVALTGVDVGAGVDDGTVTTLIVSADTGAGADANSPIEFAATDTGTGADASTLVAAINSTDIFGGADAVSTIGLAGVDAASGVDANPLIELVAADVGGSVEGQTFSDTDTGHGVDAVLLIEISSSDTGSGADTGALAAVLTHADTGAGLEGPPAVALNNAEVGTGAETSWTFAADVSHADTGSGVENTPALAFANAETSQGQDTNAGLAFTGAELGSLLDGQVIAGVLSHADVATGVDAMVTVGFTWPDAGAGIDAVALLGPRVGETGHGADTQTLLPTSYMDKRTGADPSSVRGQTVTSAKRGQADPVPRPTLE